MKKSVLFITNIPAPYRIDFYNELGKEVNLTVLFEEEIEIKGKRYWSGHTERYEKVVFESDKNEKNKIKDVIAAGILNEEYLYAVEES